MGQERETSVAAMEDTSFSSFTEGLGGFLDALLQAGRLLDSHRTGTVDLRGHQFILQH